MPKFSIDFLNFTSPATTADTAASIEAGAAEEAEVVELVMTGAGETAAADTPHTAAAYFCDFATTGTAGSSPTPESFSQRGAVSAMAADIEYTAEPTNINTVALVAMGFNMRSGIRWAVPRGEGIWVNGDETEDGLCWTVVAQAAGAVDGHMHWWE